MTLQQLRYIIAIEQSGSFSEAAKRLFISQPSISALVKDLEQELNITIFRRSRSGVVITAEGKLLLKYAYEMMEHEAAIYNCFTTAAPRQQFSVTSQHYGFVISAFAFLAQKSCAKSYDFRLRESITSKVIEDVAKQRSEVGVLFLSDVSSPHVTKLLRENNLDFAPLAESKASVILSKKHPLSKQKTISIQDLETYPCIIFDQENHIPAFYAEEVSIPYFTPSKILRVTNIYAAQKFMHCCDAYNIGTGIGDSLSSVEFSDKTGVRTVPLEQDIPITIGWIGLKNSILSPIGLDFITLLTEEIAIHSPKTKQNKK